MNTGAVDNEVLRNIYNEEGDVVSAAVIRGPEDDPSINEHYHKKIGTTDSMMIKN